MLSWFVNYCRLGDCFLPLCQLDSWWERSSATGVTMPWLDQHHCSLVVFTAAVTKRKRPSYRVFFLLSHPKNDSWEILTLGTFLMGFTI